jgi:hypothetical protein
MGISVICISGKLEAFVRAEEGYWRGALEAKGRRANIGTKRRPIGARRENDLASHRRFSAHRGKNQNEETYTLSKKGLVG